ncbi:uncharacterized protein BDZ83DRAFT_627560 [Colletotrichum acutatum]|uniref:Secreted protein n=1 Tax=Glomerella acutata TaxID=27357 RepID=A0AAD8UGU3_GLOAC|nr:uncharacterized protein BDZ83DRAFT_627560 [Colletotrichum acutatum]KAK1722898.1 hypothetical protein BDZ83DRAFT_627560 [Colletotrichum acutatum]
MRLNVLVLLFCSTGALAQRTLGCRMPNKSLNPSPNICNAAGGTFVMINRQPGCCTRGRDGPVVTESRFISGCNANGGFVSGPEVLANSC